MLTAIGLIAALMLTAMAFAAEDANQPAAAVEQPQPTAEATEVQQAAPVITSGGSLQTIAFKKDMPITDALKMLAQMYQKNIIPSAKVAGNVTVGTLYDVTFEEALQAILGTNKYDMNGNFIRVYTMEEYKADKTRLEQETITLYYISAEDAKKLAEPLLSDMGKIGITTPAQKDTVAGKGGDTLAIQDLLMVSDYPENIKAIKESLMKVDNAPPQVLIEVTVLEAKLTDDTEFGVDFKSLDLDIDSSGTIGLGDSGVSQTGLASGVSAGGLNIGIINDNLSVFIRALEVVTEITTLANPKILALNKQAGKLIIGKEDGYLSSNTVGQGGTGDTLTSTVEMLESGTVLEFRPFVGRDGLIRMELHPEQSDGQINGSGLPTKTTTEVMSNVMVRDGKTIVLGGLYKEKTNLGHSQVPLLGDIPFIGQLFKKTNDKSERVELIVLLTPHIINEPEQADGATRMQDVERLAYNARQNITWLSRAKWDEKRYANAVKLYDQGNDQAALAELDGYWFWDADRNNLDAIRLKESIIRRQQPDKVNQIERIMVGNLEKEQSGKWQRR